MARLMSCAHTVSQVLDRSKTVTRRLGWADLKPGQQLILTDRSPRGGHPYRRLATVEVVEVTVQPLWMLRPGDVTAEGFPDWSDEQFIGFYCDTFGVDRVTAVTRIAWRYL